MSQIGKLPRTAKIISLEVHIFSIKTICIGQSRPATGVRPMPLVLKIVWNADGSVTAFSHRKKVFKTLAVEPRAPLDQFCEKYFGTKDHKQWKTRFILR